MSEFVAHKAFDEAHERQAQAAHHGASWVPIAAAILAVVTAIFSLLATQRSIAGIIAKNEAILHTTMASDAYNEYEARSIKQHIYEAQVAGGLTRNTTRMLAVAAHEKSAAVPILAKARALERESETASARAERLVGSYETMEIGVTFLDIAIVLVSISALATTRILTVVAGLAVTSGFIVCVIGALR